MLRLKTAVIGFLVAFAAVLLLLRIVDFKRLVDDFRVPETGARWSDADAWAPVSSNDPVWGRRSAPATIVVFGDLESPASASVEDSLAQLKKDYGKDKLRIVWKHNVLVHRQTSRPVLVAAETVHALGGSEAFWKFHALAYAHQNALTRENFETWGLPGRRACRRVPQSPRCGHVRSQSRRRHRPGAPAERGDVAGDVSSTACRCPMLSRSRAITRR